MDRRHETPLAVSQLFLMLLELGDVGTDGDHATVAGAKFVDLQPSAIRQLPLIGRAAVRTIRAGEAPLMRARNHFLLDPLARRSGNDVLIAEPVILLVLGVAHHQAVEGIPEDERFRYALDRGTQPKVSGFGSLRQ